MTEKLKPWEQLPDEPDLWYNRFKDFYLPTQSLSEAYYTYYEQKHGHRPTRKGYTSSWGEAAKKWEWERRGLEYKRAVAAEAFDLAAADKAELYERVEKIAKALESLALDKLLVDGFADTNAALRGLKTALELKMMLADRPEYLDKIAKMNEEQLDKEIARLLESWDAESVDDTIVSNGETETSSGAG